MHVVEHNRNTTMHLPQHNEHTTCALPYRNRICFYQNLLLLLWTYFFTFYYYDPHPSRAAQVVEAQAMCPTLEPYVREELVVSSCR